MRNLFILAILVFSISAVQAQKAPTYTTKSDAQSVSILKKVHQKYGAYSSMQMNIKLTVKSGKNSDIQTSKLTVKGDKFRMTSKAQDMASDGKTLWNHQITAKECYISNADEEEMGMFGSPDKMLKMYEKDFISALVATVQENGRTVYKIEFKPKSKNSDFTKVRLTVDKATSRVNRIKMFDRSNTHYSIEMSNFKSNVSVSDSFFKIDVKKLPKGTEGIDMR
jgi:outer membrane lipoprotein-sorting protein